jgi:hypothetical protein
MDDNQNWRLKAKLDAEDGRGKLDADDRRSWLDRILGRVRGPDIVREVGEVVPHDVAVTHDGDVLFAYAASEASLSTARSAIEAAFRNDGIKAHILISHWDDRYDEWLQVDPPLTGKAKRKQEATERADERVESRTMIASAGKEIRGEVERSMHEWADKLGLRCEVIDHPHLLTAQVAFTVTGPKRKIDEFAEGLRAEELATMRAERAVMLSPL